MKVFVYGTLKRGYGNWGWALRDRATYIGKAVTKNATFDMLHAGFPVLMEGGKCAAAGEVFEVNKEILADLDRLEGEGIMYHRKVIPVVLETGEELQASVYIGGNGWSRRGGPMVKQNKKGFLEWL